MSSADNSYFLNTITQSLNSSVLASQTARDSQQLLLSTNTQLQQQHQSNTNNNNQGTTSISLTDELVKEYLLYRGFTTTLRIFDQDLKQDRDRSFRVDKITEQLLFYIHSFDLNGFMDYWTYLDQKFFTKLTLKMGGTNSLTKRYEINLMRYYLVNAVKTGKIDKAFEFIENYLVKLQSQTEWKEWYCLPFIKNPEDHTFFSIYFSQPWIDALMVSLQNFLNILFQSLPFPRLLNYDESLFWFKQNNIKANVPTFADFERDFLQADLTDEFQPIETPIEKTTQSLHFTNVVKNLNKAFKSKIETNKLENATKAL